jgi:hypothetical protein
MTGFDTPIPVLVIVAWAVAAAALVLVRHAGLQAALSHRSCWTITVLRVLALAVVALLLLQPYREQRVPDRDAFRAVMLLDASASMTVQDAGDGRSRLDVVRDAVAASGSGDRTLLDRLGEICRMEVRTFADGVRPWRPGAPVPMLPGRTALGSALQGLLEESSGPPLGAVLVLSDGHSNHGPSPTEIGKQFRARGVPVSCLGIGALRQPGDVHVRFAAGQLKARKGDPLTLSVLIENRFDHAISSRLTIADAQAVVAEREVAVPARATHEERIDVTPLRAGYVSYRARLHAVAGDVQPDTDVDYVGVEVKEPDRFQVLFLAAHLGCEYRCLRLLCDAHPQLALAAAIQTGKASFFQVGLRDGPEGRLDGFPTEASTLNRFDAVVLDARAVSGLGAKGIEALVGFVDRRGGGLLVFGPGEDLPEALRELLPLAPVPAAALRARERLQTSPEFIFDRDPARALDPVAGLPVPAGEPVWLSPTLKRGARSAAGLRGTDLCALAAQSFGSGRSAYLGIESTWRWRLASAAGESSHAAFWNSLLVWLSSTGKQRLRSLAEGAKAGLGEAVSLDVHLLGSDFLPAPDARVTAAVTTPAGKAIDVALDALAETPGHYTATFFPEEPGEHRVAYRVEAPSGDLGREAHFLARRTGVETEDTGYREDLLRDLARITGGVFVPYRDQGDLSQLPLSASVPLKTTRLYWTRHGALLAALAALLGAEWFLRRRLGLK